MSATMDSQRLAQYMSQGTRLAAPPILSIPGFTHPVADVWLEDVCGPRGLLPYTPPGLRKVLEEGGPGGDLEREACLDYRLIRLLIQHVCGPGFAASYPDAAQGAVLVFMTGVGEIARLVGDIGQEPGVWVLPLHGGLSGQEQAQVFRSPPKGRCVGAWVGVLTSCFYDQPI
jgi:HrpA-like RNA helicase